MKLDDLKKLHQKKYRTQLGFYLVEGEHLILELIKANKASSIFSNVTIYFTDSFTELLSQLNHPFKTQLVSTKQMAQISDTKSPQGIVACVPLPSAPINTTQINTKERCVYLHEIQDPGNLGTIIRTLAWFGNFRLLLSSNSVDPFNPKVVRASMGAIFHVSIEQGVKLDDLQQRFSRFAYLDMQGELVSAKSFSNHQCYLFGNEARGVPREDLIACKAQAFTIAGSGSIDSLNVASAVNICAYQLSL